MKRSRRCALRRLAVGGAAMLGLAAARPARAAALERIRERGSLSIAVYKEMPPFFDAGAGIDADIARALAGALGLKLALLPFHADENMNDDLRNLVWRGHYLGFGPADVLLHVPVDKPLMDANPQVKIFAPYYTESVAIARRRDRLPRLSSLSDLAGHRVAVPGRTLAGWLLIGADGGAYREQLSTDWNNGCEAARALQRGDFSAAAGHRSELDSVLGRDAAFAIEPLPSPRAPRHGWAVGCAVKAGSADLAQAVQSAMNDLSGQGVLKGIFERANVSMAPSASSPQR